MGGPIKITNHAGRASEHSTPAFVRARRRAWGALAAALIGVWISEGLGGVSWWWFSAGGVLAVLSALLPSVRWGMCAFASVLCVAGGWAAVRFREPPADRIDRLVSPGSIVRLEGVVLTDPVRQERPTGPAAPGYWMSDNASFRLRVTSMGEGEASRRASGEVRVSGGVSMLGTARAGDRVALTGVFRGPGRASNPGEPDWLRMGNEAGRAGSVALGQSVLLEVRSTPGGWSGLVAGALRTRAVWRERALGALGEERGVVGALVLGERDDAFDGMYRVFQRAGVAHVLAVSGFHVAMLCGLAVLAVRVTGDRGRLETLVVILVVVTLLVFVPARSPIVRACVLALALIAGDALGRRWDRLSLLAWAGVGLLIWKPGEALSLGYLLSVGVTALLIALAERERRERWDLIERQRPGDLPHRIGRRAWAVVRLNTACWAVSAPTILAATGVFSPLAPLATVVIVPVAGVLLVLGWAQAVLGVVWPTGAAGTVFIVEHAGAFTGAVARWFDGLPGSSLLIPGVGPFWAAFVTAGVLGWLFVRAQRRVFVSVLVLGTGYAVAAGWSVGRVDGLRIDMLDVGDGSALLLRSGGEAVLWDCGGLHRDVGDAVCDAAIALGVRRIPTAVVTHPDLDHFNALPTVAERMGLRTVLVPTPMLEVQSGGWAEVRAELERAGVVVRGLTIGDRLGIGRIEGVVLWPPAERAERWLGNDGSLVVRLAVPTATGVRHALLTGDVQRAGIAGLEASGADLSAAVLEVPHHGSAIPPAIALVERVAPAIALQSTGPSRLNDDRWLAARARTRWLSTAERGAVWAWIRADGRVEWGSKHE